MVHGRGGVGALTRHMGGGLARWGVWSYRGARGRGGGLVLTRPSLVSAKVHRRCTSLAPKSPAPHCASLARQTPPRVRLVRYPPPPAPRYRQTPPARLVSANPPTPRAPR